MAEVEGRNGCTADFGPAQTSSSTPDISQENDASQTSDRTSVTPAQEAGRKGSLMPQPTHLLLKEKIKQLEEECGEPERRVLARARKKLLKEVSNFLADKSKTADDRIGYLQSKVIALVSDRGRLESEVVPLRKKVASQATALSAAKEDADRATLRALKFERLSRSLQLKNIQLCEDMEARMAAHSKFEADLQKISRQIDDQGSEAERCQVENQSLREKMELLVQQMVVKEELHMRQLKAKDLETRLAEAKCAAEAEAAATARIELDMSRQAEAVMQQKLDLQSQQVEQVKTTISKTTAVLEQFHESEKKRTREVKAFEKQVQKRDKEIKSLQESLQLATNFIRDLQADNAGLKKQGPEELVRVRAQNETLENLARALNKEVQALKANQRATCGPPPPSAAEPMGPSSEQISTSAATASQGNPLDSTVVEARGAGQPLPSMGPIPSAAHLPADEAGGGECKAAVPGTCICGDATASPSPLSVSGADSSRHGTGVDGCPVTEAVDGASPPQLPVSCEAVQSSMQGACPAADNRAEGCMPGRKVVAGMLHGVELPMEKENVPNGEATEGEVAWQGREPAGLGPSVPTLHQSRDSRVSAEVASCLLDEAGQCAVDVLANVLGDALQLQAMMGEHEAKDRLAHSGHAQQQHLESAVHGT